MYCVAFCVYRYVRTIQCVALSVYRLVYNVEWAACSIQCVVYTVPLHRQVDEHLKMEKAECTGKAKVGRDVWKVEKTLLNRKEESWSPKASVYSSVYCGQSQSQPRIRTGGGPK